MTALPRRDDDRGITLAETLVGAVLLIVVTALAATLLVTGQRAAADTQNRGEAAEAQRVAFEAVTRVLRTATSVRLASSIDPAPPIQHGSDGRSVTVFANIDPPANATSVPLPSRVTYAVDAAGTLTETVTPADPVVPSAGGFSFSGTGTTRIVATRVLNSPTQPVFTYVRPRSVPPSTVCTVVAGCPVPLTAAGTPESTLAARAGVRSIHVDLTLEATTARAGSEVSFRSRVHLAGSGVLREQPVNAVMRRVRRDDDSGFALIVVMGLMLVLTLLVMVAVASATAGVRTSRAGQQYHSAQDAAQAGIQSFIYNLNRKDDYYADYINPPAGSFTPLSSSIADAEGSFRVERISTTQEVQATGRLLLRATGRMGDEEREMTVALGKASFLDYLYFTKFETVPPVAAADPEWASVNCATLAPRPSGCSRLSFTSVDGLTGPVHSQDQIVINGNPVFGDKFTTDWTGDAAGKLWVEGGTGSAPVFQPGYPRSVPISFPSTNDKLAAQARSGTGCRYFGPTRVLFNAGGTMTVTSPYSGNRGPACGNFASAPYTVTVPVPPAGLLYVEDGVADCPTARMSSLLFPVPNDTALLNTSKLGYSCTQGDVFVEGWVKDRITLAASNNVVITGDLRYVTGSSAILGLVAGSVVAVYHPVTCDTSFNGASLGGPAENGRSAAGRCEQGTNTVAPVVSGGTTAPSRPTAYPVTNITVQAVVLATQNGFLVQNHLIGAALGSLTVDGAIAQAYRGGVGRLSGTTLTKIAGYDKAYTYDPRAAYAPPPYLASLADSAWVVKEFGEQSKLTLDRPHYGDAVSLELLTAGLLGLLGLAVGSFLNVVVWRVPRGESVVRPASACPGCGAAIRPRDNVPVVGWLLLRGRCRACSAPISRRYPLVELATAGLFVVMALSFGLDAALPAYLYLAAVGLALALIDLDHKRLPDALTLPSYPVLVVLLGAAALAGAEGSWLRALLGGAAMFAVYFALCFAYPAGMGFGDVKLAGVLGLATAWVGWGAWSVGLFLGFLLGGVFGIGLILAGKGGRKTAVPFGPFMLLGALVAVLVGSELVAGYADLTGL